MAGKGAGVVVLGHHLEQFHFYNKPAPISNRWYRTAPHRVSRLRQQRLNPQPVQQQQLLAMAPCC